MSATVSSLPALDLIRVRGARTHNLRAIDVDIPRDKLVVITGVSGSGKSSLAFDTLFAEGQRRYLETVSAGARQFLDQMQRPDVDEIDGLPPTLSVEQRSGAIQPRSTLATITEIYDFLRLLYARAGTLHCYQCGRPVSQQSPQAIVDGILSLEAGQKAMILAPLVQGRKGKHRDVFERIVRDGFVRARVDGAIVDAAAPPDLHASKRHDIEVIIDRIVVKEGLRARLQESVELALKQGQGVCLVAHQAGDTWHDRLFSSKFACPDCALSFPEIEPRTFSFNSPYGACPACDGLGVIAPPAPSGKPGRAGRVPDAPATICPECHGARLGPVSRAVQLSGVGIHEFTARTVAEAERVAADWPTQVTAPPEQRVAARLAPEVAKRLSYLRRLGVGYLTLDRPVGSLSGGEYQRARLAGCLGSGLRGVCYILDEPTIGLHPRDAQRLFATLCELRDQGSSVLIVEHDLALIGQADFVIDLGPGAGREGGRVVATGTPAAIAANPDSVTGLYLRQGFARLDFESEISNLKSEPTTPHSSWLTVSGARAHNLCDVMARFPLGALTAVTGVSGSGKSSLVMETLVPLVRRALDARYGPRPPPANDESALPSEQVSPGAQVAGVEAIDRLIEIDQAPLGRNSRSNPATASGVWDEIRRLFAKTRDARLRGFRAARFSFNAPGGRCDTCRGLGTRRIGMHFLPDIDIVCAACRGTRFNRQTLAVKFRGKSVADVLELRIDEAVEFFGNFAGLRQTLATFVEVGLGYLPLGQSSVTLSGGEAQRIRLATELSRPAAGRTLYVLDEPTTGLHPADIDRLLQLLRRLVQQGQTVIIIEHELHVIRAADYVIDLGPEGGRDGGRIVAEGIPAEIARSSNSHTGLALNSLKGWPPASDPVV
ncbi:MAG: ABC-ATPase UvrA [Planctomycetaceae bacterium]|nr:ABC-ATPase UvrA [Planctomycetaceae bacterium]